MKELISDMNADLSQNIEYDNLLLQFYVFGLTWLDASGMLTWTI